MRRMGGILALFLGAVIVHRLLLWSVLLWFELRASGPEESLDGDPARVLRLDRTLIALVALPTLLLANRLWRAGRRGG
jgi:hypothetical protein